MWFGKHKIIFSYDPNIDDMKLDHGVMFKIERWLTDNALYVTFKENPPVFDGFVTLFVSYTFVLKKEDAVAFKMEYM